MRNYCKAYYLKDLRQFRQWVEKCEGDGEELSDDDVVYLWDDFTVVKSPIIPDKGLLFDEITPEWQVFCQKMLKFEIPEDLGYAYERTKEESASSGDASEEQNNISVDVRE